MRSFVAFVCVAGAVALAAVVAESKQIQGGGKGAGGLFGGQVDVETAFNLLAKGADPLIIANQPPAIRPLMEQFAAASKITNGLLTRQQFQVFWTQVQQGGGIQGIKVDPGPVQKAQPPDKTDDADEQTLRAAGISSDADSLLEFFRERMQPKVELDKLLAVARQLGDADAKTRAKAAAKLLARGSLAIPALRQVVNELDNPLAAQQARQCLEWVEGKRSAELSAAAAKVLAARQSGGATKTLLEFLPLADDETVVAAVKVALDSLAARPGPADLALLAALKDDLPLRRAVAVEVLAASWHSEVLPKVRELLADPKPQVRLRAALALTQRLDEKGVAVLIDLLVELPPSECRKAELALHELAGEWSPNPRVSGDDDLARKIRREVWAGWWRSIDGPALLGEFRRRSLTKAEQVQVEALITHLGDPSPAKREKATTELTAMGPKVVNLLTEAAKSANLEQSRRAQKCLRQIALNEEKQKLPTAAPRLLAVRKPAGACEALLTYLCFADDRMKEEVGKALKSLAVMDGKADPAVIAALSEKESIKRRAAAEALVAAGGANLPAVRALLKHADPQVRLRVALALANSQDREAMPALIDLLAVLPRDQSQEIMEFLDRIAGGQGPAVVGGNDDAATRKKLSDAWHGWWKDKGATVDLPALAKAPAVSGLIVVAELGPSGGKGAAKKGGKGGPGGFQIDPKILGKKGGGLVAQPAPVMPVNGSDRLIAIDREGQVHWQIENLDHPIDFQLLTGGRVLIAEYAANRVTERDLKGRILWESNSLPGSPVNVQRLANGNTFIALYDVQATGGGSMVEVDKTGKTVATFPNPVAAGAAKSVPILRAAYKLADGQMISLHSKGIAVRMDANGKEIKRFTMPTLGGASVVIVQAPNFAANIDMTSKGHILVMLENNTVAEYDLDGKLVWQAHAAGNRATRLPNGYTMVASQTAGVVELDKAGKTVWQYHPPPGYQPVRARPMGGVSVAKPVAVEALFAAPAKAAHGGIDPKVVTAWEKAGGQFGWMTDVSNALGVDFTKGRPPDPVVQAGFWFPNAPPPGAMASLPAPSVPFGLHFSLTRGKQGNVTDAHVKELVGLKQMEALYLHCNNQVSDAGLKSLAGLSQLHTLDLGWTNVTDKGLKELARLKQLRRLNVGGAPLTDAGMKELGALKQLEKLDVSWMPVTDAGLKELA
ncbi:MAG TPA: HEAT repeat domain-containing protein, partial [Gemmataceae bacterium]|nr:HEAT repeat domain-containing protein [Gemmataceae bacterium]